MKFAIYFEMVWLNTHAHLLTGENVTWVMARWTVTVLLISSFFCEFENFRNKKLKYRIP